jgi:hypothetical protein
MIVLHRFPCLLGWSCGRLRADAVHDDIVSWGIAQSKHLSISLQVVRMKTELSVRLPPPACSRRDASFLYCSDLRSLDSLCTVFDQRPHGRYNMPSHTLILEAEMTRLSLTGDLGTTSPCSADTVHASAGRCMMMTRTAVTDGVAGCPILQPQCTTRYPSGFVRWCIEISTTL